MLHKIVALLTGAEFFYALIETEPTFHGVMIHVDPSPVMVFIFLTILQSAGSWILAKITNLEQGKIYIGLDFLMNIVMLIYLVQ